MQRRKSKAAAVSLKDYDAYAKPMEDFQIKTKTGGTITLVSSVIIAILVLSEFVTFMGTEFQPSLSVDAGRKEKMVINLDVTFPKVPCFMISLDVMDVSGDHQNGVEHNMLKTRIDKFGKVISKQNIKLRVKNNSTADCGDCYGAKKGCCNTCEEVRAAYQDAGWAFDYDTIHQCVKEGFVDKMKDQADEGCQFHGVAKINKVQGNLHFAPGASYNRDGMHIHDLHDFKKPEGKWDFTHKINSLSFGALAATPLSNPLDNVEKTANTKYLLYQYYVKVVGTEFLYRNGSVLSTNQYAVTENVLDVSPRVGTMPTQMPGVFLNFEISPMLIKYTEYSQSFSHFLTNLCAIVGGVVTVAGMIDQFLFSAQRRVSNKVDLGKQT